MNKQVLGFAELMKKPHLLWNNVQKTDGCWNWTKGLNKDGYASIRVGPTSVLAHRAAFFLRFRYIDISGCVCHSCDNPRCCNPEHLFLDDHKGNMGDMKAKGRRKNINSGEKNGRAKLTTDSAKEIRKLFSEGLTKTELAKRFNVGNSTIGRVCNGENWK